MKNPQKVVNNLIILDFIERRYSNLWIYLKYLYHWNSFFAYIFISIHFSVIWDEYSVNLKYCKSMSKKLVLLNDKISNKRPKLNPKWMEYLRMVLILLIHIFAPMKSFKKNWKIRVYIFYIQRLKIGHFRIVSYSWISCQIR